MENKYKKLLKNTSWTLIGNAGSKILSFLLLPLYTRWLGTAGFGESDLVTTYSSFLVCIMTLSVSDAIFVFTKNQDDSIKKSYYTTSLVFELLLLAIWIALFSGGSFIFKAFSLKNSFSDNLWYIYAIVFTTFLQQYSQQFILSLEKIKIYSFTGIVHALVTFVFSYLLIPSLGVKGYILSMIISNLLTAFYSFSCSNSYRYISFNEVDKGKIREVLTYSIPLIPNGIMWWLVSALNRPVMEHNLDYSSIGIFSVANRFPGVITMVFTVFSVAWTISVFEEYGKDGFGRFYSNTFRYLFGIVAIVASFVVVFSDIIITIFAAPSFHDASIYMPLLIVGSVFSCMSSFFGTCFSVVKQSKYFFYSSVWGAATAIFFNFLLIPRWGIWGACLSVVASFIAMMISRYIYSKKFVKEGLLVTASIYGMLVVIESLIAIFVDNLAIKIASLLIPLSIVYFMDGRNIIDKLRKDLGKKVQ